MIRVPFGKYMFIFSYIFVKKKDFDLGIINKHQIN